MCFALRSAGEQYDHNSPETIHAIRSTNIGRNPHADTDSDTKIDKLHYNDIRTWCVHIRKLGCIPCVTVAAISPGPIHKQIHPNRGMSNVYCITTVVTATVAAHRTTPHLQPISIHFMNEIVIMRRSKGLAQAERIAWAMCVT